MDELLACESESPENLDITVIIGQLASYYENVAISFQEFNEKYNNARKKNRNSSKIG